MGDLDKNLLENKYIFHPHKIFIHVEGWFCHLRINHDNNS